MNFKNFCKTTIFLLLASFFVSNSESDDNFEVGEQNHGVSHLCIYQHWFRDELIVCDIKQTTAFACVGAIKGEIQLCEKSTQNEIFAPVCLQENNGQIITCKYKNFVSGNLCLPRKSLSNMRKDSFTKYNSTPLITFRVCDNKKRFACFNEGEIEQCDQLKVDSKTYSETLYETNYPEKPLKNQTNEYNNQKVKITSNFQRKLSDIETQNRTLHHLLLDFNETFRASLAKGNFQQHLEKTNHEISQERNSHKTSSDKNKSNHKTSKRRRHKKIEHNYDKGGRDKNTTDAKYSNPQYNNVSSEIKHSGAEKLEIDSSKSKEFNKYFHILKCEDCMIDNVIKVEKDAYNVEMWTLPTI